MTDVLVRYFAAAADETGREEERIAAATLGELRATLLARYAGLERIIANGSFLVDGVATGEPERPIAHQVDVLPPFSGG